jgi:hypothetical protein
MKMECAFVGACDAKCGAGAVVTNLTHDEKIRLGTEARQLLKLFHAVTVSKDAGLR